MHEYIDILRSAKKSPYRVFHDIFAKIAKSKLHSFKHFFHGQKALPKEKFLLKKTANF